MQTEEDRIRYRKQGEREWKKGRRKQGGRCKHGEWYKQREREWRREDEGGLAQAGEEVKRPGKVVSQALSTWLGQFHFNNTM